MSINEYEKKMLLSKEEYNFYLKKFANLAIPRTNQYSPITQVNYYYDNENYDLFKRSETLRIRQINDSMFLQRKMKKKYVKGISCCEETEVGIDFLPSKIVLDDCIYRYIGCLVTKRTNFSNDRAIVSLDENIYLGVVDFELEIDAKTPKEVNEYSKEFMSTTFQAWPKEHGKYSRFIRQLKKVNMQYNYKDAY